MLAQFRLRFERFYDENRESMGDLWEPLSIIETIERRLEIIDEKIEDIRG